MLPLPVKAGEIVPSFGGQLARNVAHGALSDYVMQELGLAVNAFPSARTGSSLVVERSPQKRDTQRFTVDQLDWWKRLAENADAVGSPLPDLNPDPPLRDMLNSDDL